MELTIRQLAVAFRRPARTVKRWLQIWHALGVSGIRRAKAEGAARWSYLVDRDLVDRWVRGELPTPHASRIVEMRQAA